MQRCPVPAREGEYCDYVFHEGSSGLFGDELPGRWLELPEALEAYKNIFRGYALNGDYGLFPQKGVLNLMGRALSRFHRLTGVRNNIEPDGILPPAGWYDTHAAL